MTKPRITKKSAPAAFPDAEVFPDPLQEVLLEEEIPQFTEAPQIPQVQMAFTVSLNQEGNYYTALHQVGGSYDISVLRDATVSDVAAAVAAIDRDIKEQALADRITRTILVNLPKQAPTPKEQMGAALKKRKASILK